MQQQPDMPPFSPAGSWRGPAGAPSPISSRPPAPQQQQQQQQQQVTTDELAATTAASGSGFGSHDGLGGAGGEEGERGGGSSSSAGNRWPRQETLALLKIRSEMDAAFREAALKGPLWEEVSRKLADMGYRRGAKKCREKFENVDKYYRRTKDGRAGRGDGKTYRFFTELEALHGAHPTPVAVAPPPAMKVNAAIGPPAAARFPAETPTPPPVTLVPQSVPPMATDASACVMTVRDASFSLESTEGSDGEDTDDETADVDGGKRKRRGGNGAGGGGGKAMRFFEGLMRQVMERQEAMQQRLLDTIERRDQDRMIREEAWRRQEVARLAREQDALAQERAVAASRDAAVVSFIQRVTGQIIPAVPTISSPPVITSLRPPPLQPIPVASAAPAPAPAPSKHQQQAAPVQPHHATQMTIQPRTPKAPPHVTPTPAHEPQTPQPQQNKEIVRVVETPADTAAPGAPGCGGASPSRWPKAEVHALIQLRTEMETRYQDAAPKGPLWEDISVGMRRLGYSRSSKRCKEKWENINKYFKKVKESSRKRPEDSKTCPYFHQLDALYRTKALATSTAAVNASPRPEPAAVTVLAPVPLSQTPPAPRVVVERHADGKNCSNGNGNGFAASNGGMQMKAASNGSAAPRFSSVECGGAAVAAASNGNGNGNATNKPAEPKQEGAAVPKETAEQQQPAVAMNHNYGNDRMDDDMYSDDDSMDEDDDDFDDEDDDDRRDSLAQYNIHFQRQPQHQHQNVVRPNANGAGAGGNPAAGPGGGAAAAAPNGTPFLGMVQ